LAERLGKKEPEVSQMLTVLLELARGQDITKISMRELRKALVSVKSGGQSTSTVADFVSSEGNAIAFNEPIEVVLSRVGDLYEARYEPLDIATLGGTARAALDGFDKSLRTLYARYLLNKADREEEREGLRSAREGRILTAFEELLKQD